MANKVILMADLHIKPSNVHIIAEQLDRIFDYANRSLDYTILIAGDIFDSPMVGDKTMAPANVVRKSGLGFFCNFFRICYCYGNHDINPGDVSAAASLMPWYLPTNVTMSDYLFEKAQWDLEHLAILNWNWKGREEPLEIERYRREDNSKRILLGHCAVQGQLLRGNTASHKDTFMLTPDEINSFGFGYVALGHYHKRQKYYVGAFIQHGFGEEGNPTGFIELDLDTWETKEVPATAPTYHTLHQRVERTPGDKNFYRVVFKQKLTESDWNFLSANNYSPYMDVPRVERTRRLDVGQDFDPKLSNADVFKIWSKTNNIPLEDNEIERYCREIDILEESYYKEDSQ